MKLLAFGATGSVGRELVEQALEQGHSVTAFVRDPAKLGIAHPELQIFQGDALDPASVEAAVRGQQAVLCALGAGRKGVVRSEGTRNIISTMEKAGVKRLICQTTLGVGDSEGNLNFFWKRIMFGMLLRQAFDDHVIQEDHIRQSQLDWTIVRPGAFTDGGSHRSVPIWLSGKRQDDGAQDLTGRCCRFHVASAGRPDLSAPDTGSVVLSWISINDQWRICFRFIDGDAYDVEITDYH